MSIHTTTWRPDTCDCVVHYSWDDSLSESERVHTPVEEVTTHDGQVIKRYTCPAHTNVSAEGKHIEQHDIILEENRRKNFVVNHILENSDVSMVNLVDRDGVQVKEYKKGFEPEWSFDADRNLKITLKGSIAKKTKENLKTIVDEQYEKVIFE